MEFKKYFSYAILLLLNIQFHIIIKGDYISSYKGHSIFALVLSILFFQNPLLIALAIIGSNIPDYDHKVKKDTVYKMIILGLIVFIALYIMNLPYYLGIIILLFGTIFYFSNHRSFTHSILGLCILTILTTLILILAIDLIPISYSYWLITILIALLGFLFLNKKLLYVFLPCLFVSVFFIGNGNINYIQITLAIFLGILSHLILDSFSPAGIKLFAPISSKKVYKKFGIVAMGFLIILFILNFYFNSIWFLNYFL